MDYKKIFLEEATPTTIGGQAIMEGVMMRGPDRNAIAVRIPDGSIYLKTEKRKPEGEWKKIPFIRGIVSFFMSLIIGMSTLMQSADILEQFMEDDETEPGKAEGWLTKRFGERAVWNFMLVTSVIIAVIISVLGFVIFPTIAVNWLGKWIGSSIVLNLIEGIFRILLFVLYVLLIRRMEDIRTLFQYHGAEHKTIHCYENGQPLDPAHAQGFYTLHPRCGTSFMMFVFIISLLLFSLLGWPNIWMRIASRLLLLPVIAGLSYELLKWAGRSDNILVRVLSWPGLMLQKLTTEEPNDDQLAVAIVSLKAVLVDETYPEVEGIADTDANIISPAEISRPVGILNSDEDEAIEVPHAAGPDIEELVEENTAMDDAAAENAADNIDALSWPELETNRYDEDPSVIENLIALGQKKLKEAGKDNADREAIDLFCYLMGYSRSEIITHAKELLPDADVREYIRRLEMRLSGTPMQYITKVQEFMGLPFKVDPNVLIPRLDTEVLVEQVCGVINGKGWEEPRVLDLCTGSGCIGISIAREFPNAKVTMSDVSEQAIEVARTNADINRVSSRCDFLTGNMFDPVPHGAKYEVITCNPPYIESDVIDTLEVEVRDHEPRSALDGGEDGMDYYRIISTEVADYLLPGGVLALEIGEEQATQVSLLLELSKQFNKSVVIKDLNGKDRAILIERI